MHSCKYLKLSGCEIPFSAIGEYRHLPDSICNAKCVPERLRKKFRPASVAAKFVLGGPPEEIEAARAICDGCHENQVRGCCGGEVRACKHGPVLMIIGGGGLPQCETLLEQVHV